MNAKICQKKTFRMMNMGQFTAKDAVKARWHGLMVSARDSGSNQVYLLLGIALRWNNIPSGGGGGGE